MVLHIVTHIDWLPSGEGGNITHVNHFNVLSSIFANF